MDPGGLVVSVQRWVSAEAERTTAWLHCPPQPPGRVCRKELSQPQSVYPAASFYSDFPLLRAVCRVDLEGRVAVWASGPGEIALEIQ